MKLLKKRISVLIGLLFLLAPFTTFAANKVVVIPLMSDNPPPEEYRYSGQGQREIH